MPAAIDWSPVGGIEAVRTLTVAIGPREAARRLQLSEPHAEALRRICSRKGWMDTLSPPPPEAAPAVPNGQSLSPVQQMQPVTRMEPVTTPILAASVMPSSVPKAVPKAADALAESLADDSKASRLAGSRYARRTLEHAAQLEPQEGLEQAQNVKAVISGAATIHGWEDKSSTNLRVNIYASLQPGAEPDRPVIDV